MHRIGLGMASYFPEPGGAPVAEHRRLPGCKHSGDPSPLVTQAGVADRINATMNAMKAPGGDALRDAARQDPGSEELLGRDDAVLRGG